MPTIYEYGGFKYVRLSEVPEGQRDDLKRWLYGQTQPRIEGLQPQDAIYYGDYLLFLNDMSGQVIAWD